MLSQRASNRIIANVRPGGGRSAKEFDKLCQSLIEAWDRVINGGNRGSGDMELRTVFVHDNIVSGSEAGFIIPRVGFLQDTLWLQICELTAG